jgi:hypothetical protein
MQLPCADECQDDATSRFLGNIRVDVGATAAEVGRWHPWFARLVGEMVPVGTRARVRWTTPHDLHRDRLDGSWTLEDERVPHLGTDAITGIARLPRASSTLPTSSDRHGPTLE